MGNEKRLSRKEPEKVDAFIEACIHELGLRRGLNEQRVGEAWDVASNAANFTMSRAYRNGTLYVSISSAMVRSQLFLQKDAIMDQMNAILLKDNMFYMKDRDTKPVKNIILK